MLIVKFTIVCHLSLENSVYLCIYFPLKNSVFFKGMIVAELECAVAILELNMAFLLVSIQGLNTKHYSAL